MENDVEKLKKLIKERSDKVDKLLSPLPDKDNFKAMLELRLAVSDLGTVVNILDELIQ